MQIVLIGHVCIDSNTSEHSSYINWGSPLMYMSHYYQKDLGITPTLIAPSGKDFQKYASSVKLRPAPVAAHTLVYQNHSYIYRHKLHRTQRCEHTTAAKPVSLTPDIKNILKKADIICLAPLLPNYSIEYVRQIAVLRKPGSLFALLPQGYLRSVDAKGRISEREFSDANEIIALFDLVIFSEDDHSRAHGLAADWAQTSGHTYVVVTEGDKGASWVGKDGSFHSVATEAVPESQVLDSVGCGDVFGAAMLVSYVAEKNISRAVQAGNRAARAKLFVVGN